MPLGRLLCDAIKNNAPIEKVKEILDEMRRVAVLYKKCGDTVPEIDTAMYRYKNKEVDKPIFTIIQTGFSSIDYSTEVEYRKKKLDTALHIAAAMGNVEVIELLVKDGHIPVDTTNRDGQTALMAAASAGKLNAVKTLLHLGADVNKVKNNNEKTGVLLLACRCSDDETIVLPMIRELLAWQPNHELAAAPYLPGDWFVQYTVLEYAVKNGFVNVTAELVRAGANVFFRDGKLINFSNNPTISRIIASGGLLACIKKRDFKKFKEILEQYPDVDIYFTNVEGESVSELLDKRENQDYLQLARDKKLLIQDGIQDERNASLWNSARKGHHDAVKYFLNKGAILSEPAMELVVKHCELEQIFPSSPVADKAKIIENILQRQAKHDLTAARLVTAYANFQNERLIIPTPKEDEKDSEDSAATALSSRHNFLANFYIKLLGIAAANGRIFNAFCLIKQWPVNINMLDKDKHSALSRVVQNAKDENQAMKMVTALLAAGAVLDTFAVQCAIEKNYCEVLKGFINKDRSAVVNVVDKNNRSALYLAVEKFDIELVRQIANGEPKPSNETLAATPHGRPSLMMCCIQHSSPKSLLTVLVELNITIGPEVVRQLIEKFNRDLLLILLRSKHREKIIVALDKSWTDFLFNAFENNDVELLKELAKFASIGTNVVDYATTTVASNHMTAIYIVAQGFDIQLLSFFKNVIDRKILLTIPDGQIRLPLAAALNTMFNGILPSSSTADSCIEFIDGLLNLGAVVDDEALRICLEQMTRTDNFQNEKYHEYDHYYNGYRISSFTVLNKILGANQSQVIITDKELLNQALFFLLRVYGSIYETVVQYLIARVNINQRNKNGETYFHCAARISDFEQYKLVMETLLAQNPSIDRLNTIPDLTCEEFDNKRYSVLEVAIKFAQDDEDAKKRVEILVNAGCTKYIAKAIEFAESKTFKNTLNYLKKCKNELSRPKPKLKPVTDLCVQELSQYNAPIVKPLTLEQQRIALDAEIFTTDAKLLREQLVFAIRFGTDQDAIACIDKIQARHCYEVLLIEDASKKIPLQYVNAKQTDVINKLLEFSPYTQTKEKSKEADLLDFAAYILSLDKDSQPQKNKKVRNDIFCEILGLLKQSKLKEAIQVIQASIPKVHSRIKDNTCSAILRGILKRIGAEEKDAKAADNKSAQDNLKGLYEVLQHYNVRNKKFDFALIPAPTVVVVTKVTDAKQDDAKSHDVSYSASTASAAATATVSAVATVTSPPAGNDTDIKGLSAAATKKPQSWKTVSSAQGTVDNGAQHAVHPNPASLYPGGSSGQPPIKATVQAERTTASAAPKVEFIYR